MHVMCRGSTKKSNCSALMQLNWKLKKTSEKTQTASIICFCKKDADTLLRVNTHNISTDSYYPGNELWFHVSANLILKNL